MVGRGLKAERIEEHREIARRNGERIVANPRLALDAITPGQATFTNRDLAMFAHRPSAGREPFDAGLSAVRSAPELIELSVDGTGGVRYPSRGVIAPEQRLETK